MKNRISPFIAAFYRNSYSCDEIEKLYKALTQFRVFQFDAFPNGLFPAVGRGSVTEQTSGYRAVWVRDNVHIAYAHYVTEDEALRAAAIRNASALSSFFETNKQQTRILNVIKNPEIALNPMNRPHIRFDGEIETEITEKWPHAQNDALGAFLFFFCSLAIDKAIAVTSSQREMLRNFVHYFQAIEFWKDEDSGHWEEQRKISASSIGAVNAGLTKYRELLDLPGFATDRSIIEYDLETLLDTGIKAMNTILPLECAQQETLKYREHDAALLFLADPYEIVHLNTADKILSNIRKHLQGEYGIKRYLKDSYWGPNYRSIPPEKRTIDLSEDIIQRDAFSVEGREAEWCIFDSVMSCAYGKRYLTAGDKSFLDLQTEYFNRALLQLVECPENNQRLVIPEAYFVENEMYVPNDHLPLQWAHANLLRAVIAMKKSTDS